MPPFNIWCGQQDSNLHALAVEPKSTESTNSTMPAHGCIVTPKYGIVKFQFVVQRECRGDHWSSGILQHKMLCRRH